MSSPRGAILSAAAQILSAKCDWSPTGEISFPPPNRKNTYRDELVKDAVSLAILMDRELSRQLIELEQINEGD